MQKLFNLNDKSHSLYYFSFHIVKFQEIKFFHSQTAF